MGPYYIVHVGRFTPGHSDMLSKPYQCTDRTDKNYRNHDDKCVPNQPWHMPIVPHWFTLPQFIEPFSRPVVAQVGSLCNVEAHFDFLRITGFRMMRGDASPTGSAIATSIYPGRSTCSVGEGANGTWILHCEEEVQRRLRRGQLGPRQVSMANPASIAALSICSRHLDRCSIIGFGALS